MGVKIRFLGILKPYQPQEDENGFWVVPADGRTIQNVIDETGVEDTPWEYIPTVNGDNQYRKYVLKDGDQLDFVTTFVGG
jgi:molybdopterin converting factor small subunit